ncbi:hypothetical protein G6F68_018978 [Rhizopus microsporus]|nr:hypothetical protein G6F68_018978 [Rhizopus microsporus]
MAAADLRFGRHAVLVDGLQILGPGQHAEVDLQAGRLPVGGDGLGQFLVLEPAAGRRVQVDGLAIDAGGLQQFGSAPAPATGRATRSRSRHTGPWPAIPCPRRSSAPGARARRASGPSRH